MAPAPDIGQYARIPHAVMRRRDLSATDKLVYGALLDRQGDNADAWPSLPRIADDVGANRDTVLASVRKLEARGLIEVERRGGRASNRYRVLCPENPATTPSEPEPLQPENPATSDAADEALWPENPASVAGKPGYNGGLVAGKPGSNHPQYNQPHLTNPRRSAAPKRDPGDGKIVSRLVGHWAERYKAAIGATWQSTGKAIGQMRATLRDAGGKEARVRAAIDTATSRAPPFPFNKAGGLTVANLKRHLEDLEHAAARATENKPTTADAPSNSSSRASDSADVDWGMCTKCNSAPRRNFGGPGDGELCYECYRQVRVVCAGCSAQFHPTGIVDAGRCRDCAERLDRRRRALSGCGVGPRHGRIRTFAELAERCRHDGYRRALGKLKEFLAGDAPSILALVGPRGSGKTTLASVAVIEAIEAERTAYFFDARDAVAALKASFVQAPSKSYVAQLQFTSENEWLTKLSRLHLLALDEIDLALANDYAAGQLRLLLDRRYRMGVPTIVCSAASIDTFKAAIGPDLQRRIADGGGVLSCEGWPHFTTAPQPAASTKWEEEQPESRVPTLAQLKNWNPHNGGLE